MIGNINKQVHVHRYDFDQCEDAPSKGPGWFFWDETGACCGQWADENNEVPYSSELAANEGFEEYCRTVLR